MDQSLVDSIVKLTGKPEEEVQAKLANVPIDDIYKLIDLVRDGDKASVIDFIDPIQERANVIQTNEGLEYTAKFKTNLAYEQLADWLDDNLIPYTNRLNNVIVVDCNDRDTTYKVSMKVAQLKAMADTNLQTVNDMAKPPKKFKPGNPVPPPRNPIAKALALPQNQPKSTPNKKTTMDKSERKHKGRDNYNESINDQINEGVMGMTAMDSMLPRLLTLAGRPPMDDDAITIDIDSNMQNIGQELNIEPISVEELPATEAPSIGDNMPEWASMAHIRNAFKTIQNGLGDIKVSEFAEVRSLMSDLMSQIDRMGNTITGK